MPLEPLIPDQKQDFEELIRALSHDLRAPLRAIQGFSRALSEDYAAILPQEAQRFLAQIENGTEEMAKILEGLLALSRASSTVLVRELVDISSSAEAIARDLGEQDSGRTVNWSIEPGLIVHAEPSMTLVLLRNLLENAWKYTCKTTVAEIRVFRCETPGIPSVCVEDNGIGFNPADAEQLFEPFHRQHNQADFPGSGIGLATVHRIVMKHGGRISAHSVPGEGATFCFELGSIDAVVGAGAAK